VNGQLLTPALPPRPFSWSAPRARPFSTGERWTDWSRWATQGLQAEKRRLHADADQVVALQSEWSQWPDAQLDARVKALRAAFRLDKGAVESKRRLRVEALAAISLVSQRELDRLPYRVQVLAALAMDERLVVQMGAGEGKTLAVALSGVLNGWRGRPCHVVTSNDYLAQRDAQLMQPLYGRCGVQVGSVVHGMTHEALGAAYAGDVVYATSKQLLADFLIDQIALRGRTGTVRRRLHELREDGRGSRGARTRGLYVAIVDEADSVLIDEANTPLIISSSQPNPMLSAAVLAAKSVVEDLRQGVHFHIDPQFRDIDFTEAGQALVDSLTTRLPAVWHAPERRDDLIRQAISARDVFLRDRHYIVDDGKIQILDENTGRLMEGRTWSLGLHQAIEACEGLEISHPSKTMARLSFQEFFRNYHRLSGASGTLQGVRAEMWWTYGLLTFVVPPRLPSQLRVSPLRAFVGAEQKVQAVAREVKALHARGLPVLVGTRRLADSEHIQGVLVAMGLSCSILNAKQSALEADIIAQGGEAGRITVATNMAGRGTDILIAPELAERGGLQVLMLEPHESARVDWQLFGRAGRQGQTGRAQRFACPDDDLLVRHLPFWIRPLTLAMQRWPSWCALFMPPLVRLAQVLAQRRDVRQRKQLQKRETQLRKQLSFSNDGSG
jgi:preprotein translocase subunit SecA